MIELSGALLLEGDGERIALAASGTQIVAEIETGRGAARLIFDVLAQRRLLRFLAAQLHARGLTLTVSRDRVPFARIGYGVAGPALGWLLKLRYVAFVRRPR